MAVAWRERAKKLWGWWSNFHALQGLISFIRTWWGLIFFFATVGGAVLGIAVGLALYIADVISGYWFVAVAVLAIMAATVPNYFIWKRLSPGRLAAEAPRPPEELPLEDRGTITVVQPLYVPEDHVMEEHPTPNGTTTEQEKPTEDRKYLGRGIWHEVTWQGWRLPNGYIDAEGPFCPRDEHPLVFYDGAHEQTNIEDYYEVRPPQTYLVCRNCQHRFYLTATVRSAQRIGDSRSYAAWRLGGGLTKQERLQRLIGL